MIDPTDNDGIHAHEGDEAEAYAAGAARRAEVGDQPDPLEGLAARAKADPTAAFAPAVLEAIVRVRSRDIGAFVGVRTALQKAGVPMRDLNAAIKATAERVAAAKRAAAAQAAPPPSNGDDEPVSAPPREADWRDLLMYEAGKVQNSAANCVTALVHAPEWSGVLAYNEFADRVVTLKPPPWHGDDAPEGGSKSGEWTDRDDVRLANWFAREAGMQVSALTAVEASFLVGLRQQFHPVRRYLNLLPEWDGTPRLATWLAVYCDARLQPEAYLAKVGTWFLISAVARVLQPGSKVDHCIVLEGKQGRQKSTAARLLVAEEEWFAEHNAELGDKDAYAILKGRWIVELAELDSLSRAEASKTKKYMTTAVDAYRPHYGRRVERQKRHCVFIGTVNDSEYLRDSTGNRRFWPVAVGDVDAAALARDRDLLWAEALHLYREGVQWWPDREDEALLQFEQEKRYRPHPWEAEIAQWLEVSWPLVQSQLPPDRRTEFVTVNDLLEKAVRKPREQWTDLDGITVGKIMVRLEWVRKQSRRPSDDDDRDDRGKKRRQWVYYPPGTPEYDL